MVTEWGEKIILIFYVTLHRRRSSYDRMTNLNEQLLIEKVLAGDDRAFGCLVDRYQDMAYTIAVRLLKDRTEAEDIVQESFIKSYEVLHTFRGESKFSTWIYKIVYRKSLDRLKALKRKHAESYDNIHEGDIRTEGVETAYQVLLKKERKQLLLDTISRLPAEEQTLITLYYFEEASIREVAEILEISMENVKVKLFRSRKKLYNLLNGQIQNLTA